MNYLFAYQISFPILYFYLFFDYNFITLCKTYQKIYSEYSSLLTDFSTKLVCISVHQHMDLHKKRKISPPKLKTE